MAKTLRVGMIGHGSMGKTHSHAWRLAPYSFPLKAKIELHTICGHNPAAVQPARVQLGWQFASTDWREVIDSPLIDVIDINTPNSSHAEIAIAAARAGKHVLCESPLALTVKEAESMLAAAQSAKVVHMVCHHYRRLPALAQAKRLITEGAIGQIYHYHARYAQDWLVDPEVPLGWRLQKPVSGSGAHGDINVHLIDLGRYLVSEFQEVCGMTNTFIKERPLPNGAPPREDPPGKSVGKQTKSGKVATARVGKEPETTRPQKLGRVTVDDAAMFMGRFQDGALANLEATRCAVGRKDAMTIEVNGSKGSLYFDFEEMNCLRFCDTASPADRQGFRDILVVPAVGVRPPAGQGWRGSQLSGYEHAFVQTLADFVNACAEGIPVRPSFEDGLRNQRVLHAVEESVKTRGWVKV